MAWGTVGRAALGAIGGIFMGLLLGWIVPFFTDLMVNVDGVTSSNMLVRSFTAIGSNGVTIILVSVIFGLIAGAVSDVQFGGA